MMKEVCMQIKGLSIGYIKRKSELVLKTGINLELKRGELVCLLGVNGVGKSTLLKTITGYLPEIAGDIMLEGESIKKYTPKEFSKYVSIVFTSNQVPDNMTVFELVATGRIPYTNYFGKLQSDDKYMVASALNDVGMSEFHDRNITELSDGQRQKVMIARALVQNTPIMILDEPTAFLDLSARIEVLKLLSELAHKMNIAVLLSTHDLDLAIKMSDKLWLMDSENEVYSGCPEDLVIYKTINHVFDSKEIFFDPEFGSFKLIRDTQKKVYIFGDETIKLWVSNALLRRGYKLGDSSCEYSVEIIRNKGFKFILKQKEKLINESINIEDLLLHIEKNV